MSAVPAQVVVQEVQAGARLLADLRAEIARADTKASVLAGALGIMAGLPGGHRWSPAALSPTATILWWAGATSLVTALFALLLAVLPRYRRSTWEPGRPLTYFGDIRRAARAAGSPRPWRRPAATPPSASSWRWPRRAASWPANTSASGRA